MDIVLRTNAEDASLVLKGISLYPDGSGGSCMLEVKSGSFAARVQFFFDHHPWLTFLRDLSTLAETLRGEARLGLEYERPFFALRGNGLGRVDVHGLLVEYGDHQQQLEFSFRTDQTALAPFLAELREVASAPAV